MKFRNSLVFLIAGYICILSACAPSEYQSYSAKSTDIYGPGVMQLPLVAELDVSEERVETTITRKNVSMQKMKIEAVEVLMDSLEFDILIEPRYTSNSKGYTTTLTASGYPAKYYNFHTLDTAEVKLLDAGILHVVQSKEVSVAEDGGNSKKGAATLVGVLGAGLLIILLAL